MSNQLQSALEITAPSGALDGHMLLLLIIMVLAGILGGVANYYLADRSGEPAPRDWIKYPVFGIVAALTVPLFLNMISSTLLEGARTKPVDFYAFAGFCLIYVVLSRRLFENIVQRLQRQIEQVRNDVGDIKKKQEEMPQRVEPELEKPPEPEVREVLSYNDVEILRALAEDSIVYGNLVDVCERTGLPRELVGQRLTAMKALGVIETRINDKNVLHWFVSARGKSVLDEVLGMRDEKTGAA
jgi:hypothetical protein